MEFTSEFWLGLLKGGGLGAALAIMGWLKSVAPEKLAFSKMWVKLLTGMIIGGYAAAKGIDIVTAEAALATAGTIQVIDYFVKLVVRKVYVKYGWKWCDGDIIDVDTSKDAQRLNQNG